MKKREENFGILSLINKKLFDKDFPLLLSMYFENIKKKCRVIVRVNTLDMDHQKKNNYLKAKIEYKHFNLCIFVLVQITTLTSKKHKHISILKGLRLWLNLVELCIAKLCN